MTGENFEHETEEVRLSVPYRFLNVAGAFFVATVPLQELFGVGADFSHLSHSWAYVGLKAIGSLGISAAAFAYLYFFLQSCWWWMRVNEDGISGRSWRGKEIFLPWTDIEGASKQFGLFLILKLKVKGVKLPVFLPQFVEDRRGYYRTVEKFAPQNHPLRAFSR